MVDEPSDREVRIALRALAGPNDPATFVFTLYDSASVVPLTGATVAAYVSVDGSARRVAGNLVREVGHGLYEYAPTASEMAGGTIAFWFEAPGATVTCLTAMTHP